MTEGGEGRRERKGRGKDRGQDTLRVDPFWRPIHGNEATVSIKEGRRERDRERVCVCERERERERESKTKREKEEERKRERKTKREV